MNRLFTKFLSIAAALAFVTAASAATASLSITAHPDGTVDANVVEADVRAVAARFGEATNVDVRVAEGVSGTCTGRFEKLPRDKAAWRLFRRFGFSLSPNGARDLLAIFPHGQTSGTTLAALTDSGGLHVTPNPPCPPPPPAVKGPPPPAIDYRASTPATGDPQRRLLEINERIAKENRNATAEESAEIARLGAASTFPDGPISPNLRAELSAALAEQAKAKLEAARPK